MEEPILIAVSGAPGTGKTTLGRRLAADLRLPYIAKDLIKESLFDSLGTKDREWSVKLGIASIKLLFELIEGQLEAGRSLVAESNYRREYDVPRFELFLQRYAFGMVEVHCKTERQVLFSRLEGRSDSGERHAGHSDKEVFGELDEALRQGAFDPLALGEVIVVDTTDFAQVEYHATLSAVRVAAGLSASAEIDATI